MKTSTSHTLLVLPDHTAKPIIDAIDAAKTIVRVKMFLFSDPDLVKAVVRAQKRGVDVRVMLNPARRSGESVNAPTHKKLSDAGITVLDTSPAFDVTHEKSMVVDEDAAFVQSLNWETRNLTETRDFAVITREPAEVAEVTACFDADWARKPFVVNDKTLLIWCNANGRERIAQFIDDTKESLLLQNERYQDPVIIERLVRAAMRGVKIHLLARPPHKIKKEKLIEAVGGLRILADVGVKVHKLQHLKLHGKMLLGDGTRAIIGSINLAPGSFDSRRELAIETNQPAVIEPLSKMSHHDWKHSSLLDLSDKGLAAEMESHDIDASQTLALNTGAKRNKK
ncbi:MAG TPA: phospholipase D-like domain-containing protein [Vicinamibacterales bacterium]